MSDYYYDVTPRSGNAGPLRAGLEEQICSSIASLLHEVETNLALPSGHLSSLAPASVGTAPLLPTAYTAHWLLSSALEGNRDALLPGLRLLQDGATLGEPELKYSTYVNDDIDKAAEAYLVGAEGQRISRTDTARGGLPARDIQAVPPHELDESIAQARNAVNLIAEVDAAMAEEVRTYVRELRVVQSRVIGGMSSLRFFGIIFLREPGPKTALQDYFSGIIHETSHHHLHALMTADPLVVNKTERFQSPLRRDLRPMFGIFHATFVLARLTHMFGRWGSLDRNRQDIGEEYADSRRRLSDGLQTIASHGVLTEAGNATLKSMIRLYERAPEGF